MCWSAVRFAVPCSNVGVTVVLASSVNRHVPVPVHRPDHPAKVVPASGAGVNTTAVPLGKLAVQLDGQLIPAGVLVTVPAPVPRLFTVSGMGGGGAVKVAVPDVAAFREIVQVALVPLQPPDHSANLEPDLA